MMVRYAHLLCLCLTFSQARTIDILDKCDNTTTSADYNHNDPACIALNDERTFPDTFYITALAPIFVGISGSLSALGSLLIMFIILRSSFGLSTVSHRLVFAMSVADLIASIGMGAGTLPMPKAMVYDFQGPHLGNEFTCSVQGFMVICGAVATAFYSACLAVYFMCTITFRMKDAKFRKCIEPFMYILCLLLTLPTAIMFWVYKWYNPTPFEPFCYAMSYPYYCSELEDAEMCSIRHGKSGTYKKVSRSFALFYLAFSFIIIPFIVVSSMVIIVLSVCLRGSFMRNLSNRTSAALDRRINTTENRRREEQRKQSAFIKAIAIQALAYIMASIIIQFVDLVRILDKTNHTKQLVYTAVRPCQGLLNFMVFFSQKVHNARRIDPSLSRRKAAIKVLTAREKEHFQLSGLSIVELNTAFRHENYVASAEFHYDDEENDEGVRPEGIHDPTDPPHTNAGSKPDTSSSPPKDLSSASPYQKNESHDVSNKKTSASPLDSNDGGGSNVEASAKSSSPVSFPTSSGGGAGMEISLTGFIGIVSM